MGALLQACYPAWVHLIFEIVQQRRNFLDLAPIREQRRGGKWAQNKSRHVPQHTVLSTGPPPLTATCKHAVWQMFSHSRLCSVSLWHKDNNTLPQRLFAAFREYVYVFASACAHMCIFMWECTVCVLVILRGVLAHMYHSAQVCWAHTGLFVCMTVEARVIFLLLLR